MKKRTWKVYAAWILTAEAVGGLAGWLTREGTKVYQAVVTKPPLTPPGVVFPVVWAVLYALMGAGAARVWTAKPGAARSRGLLLYWGQLTVNFLWTIIFFDLQAYGAAMIWLVLLWVLILWMLLTFWAVDPPAGKLQIPYLLWTAFAGYLNLGTWLLNR